MVELTIINGQNVRMGQRMWLVINGNQRLWTVCGWNSAKTSFLFEDSFGD